MRGEKVLNKIVFFFPFVDRVYKVWLNKPEQAIELHSNPKKIDIYKIRKLFESDQFRAKPDPGQKNF